MRTAWRLPISTPHSSQLPARAPVASTTYATMVNTTKSPRILVIGAGSRGNTYARSIHFHSTGTVVGVAEPIELKRNHFVKKYSANQFIYSSWKELLQDADRVKAGVDAICVCTLDETHAEVYRMRPSVVSMEANHV